MLCPVPAAALLLAWYMISYDVWRHLYVKPYKEGLYVAYNLGKDLIPSDSVTVSEASGYVPYKLFAFLPADQVGMLPDNGAGCRYGLLASVLADRKSDFGRFLAYYNEQENEQGLACWQQVAT